MPKKVKSRLEMVDNTIYVRAKDTRVDDVIKALQIFRKKRGNVKVALYNTQWREASLVARVEFFSRDKYNYDHVTLFDS